MTSDTSTSTTPGTPATVEIFDTTLRDGLQVEGVSATVEDKLRIAEQLDHLGVHFIEGGWPGANPKDIEFFERAASELHLSTATFVAFGSTGAVARWRSTSSIPAVAALSWSTLTRRICRRAPTTTG